MVAQSMLPDNPSARATLRRHPSIEGFLRRIEQHAQDIYTHPTFKIRELAREHRVISDLLDALDPAAGLDLKTLRLYRNQADDDLATPTDEIARLLSPSVSIADALMARLDRRHRPPLPCDPTGTIHTR